MLSRAQTVLVSACLLGHACRYDGRSKRNEKVLDALAGKAVVPICPEAAAGLGTPRPAVELRGGVGADVVAGRARAVEREGGTDRTAAFLEGAERALEAARLQGATVALLKEGSPSCGAHRVWADGSVLPGRGVTAQTLIDAGLTVVSDEGLPDASDDPGIRSAWAQRTPR